MGTKVGNIQDLGARLVIFGDINDSEMNYFNPGLGFYKGKLKIAIRSCNFTTDRHRQWRFIDGDIYSKTDVIFGDVDPKTLDVTNLKKLKLSDNAPVKTKIAGLEDVRLFERKDGLHAIGFAADRVTPTYYKKSGLAEYMIDGDKLVYLRTLEKPEENLVEKNWQPTDIPSKHFDFTYSLSQVWKDGKVLGEKYSGDIHGGTKLLAQKDGTYISIVHNKPVDRRRGQVYDRFVYLNYVALHDKTGKVIKLSKPFRFGTYENIEFANDMVEHEGQLIIGLGIRDSKFALAKIAKEKLLELFNEEKGEIRRPEILWVTD